MNKIHFTSIAIVLFAVGCGNSELELLKQKNSKLELAIEALEKDKYSADLTIAKLEGKIESLNSIIDRANNELDTQKNINKKNQDLSKQKEIEDKQNQIKILYSKIEGILDSTELGDSPDANNVTKSDLNNYKSENNKLLNDNKRQAVSHLSELAVIEPKFKEARKELVNSFFESKKEEIDAQSDWVKHLAQGFDELREKAKKRMFSLSSLSRMAEYAFEKTKLMDEEYNNNAANRIMDIRIKKLYKEEITSDDYWEFMEVKPINNFVEKIEE